MILSILYSSDVLPTFPTKYLLPIIPRGDGKENQRRNWRDDRGNYVYETTTICNVIVWNNLKLKLYNHYNKTLFNDTPVHRLYWSSKFNGIGHFKEPIHV